MLVVPVWVVVAEPSAGDTPNQCREPPSPGRDRGLRAPGSRTANRMAVPLSPSIRERACPARPGQHGQELPPKREEQQVGSILRNRLGGGPPRHRPGGTGTGSCWAAAASATTRPGSRRRLALLAEHGDTADDPVPVAIETPRGLLDRLPARHRPSPVYPINPMAVARYRNRHSRGTSGGGKLRRAGSGRSIGLLEPAWNSWSPVANHWSRMRRAAGAAVSAPNPPFSIVTTTTIGWSLVHHLSTRTRPGRDRCRAGPCRSSHRPGSFMSQPLKTSVGGAARLSARRVRRPSRTTARRPGSILTLRLRAHAGTPRRRRPGRPRSPAPTCGLTIVPPLASAE